MELPRIKSLNKKYEEAGFKIVTIETQLSKRDLDYANEFIAEHDLDFVMLRNGDRFSENDVSFTNKVNVEYMLPSNYLMDGDGNILYIHHQYKPGNESIIEEEIKQIISLYN